MAPQAKQVDTEVAGKPLSTGWLVLLAGSGGNIQVLAPWNRQGLSAVTLIRSIAEKLLSTGHPVTGHVFRVGLYLFEANPM